MTQDTEELSRIIQSKNLIFVNHLKYCLVKLLFT